LLAKFLQLQLQLTGLLLGTVQERAWLPLAPSPA